MLASTSFLSEPISTAKQEINAKRRNLILSREIAAKIYLQKLDIMHSHIYRNKTTTKSLKSPLEGRSDNVSSIFQVSPKTIRDIWNRRTWQHATSHLWIIEEEQYPQTAVMNLKIQV